MSLEFHLCNNLRHLVFALADIVGRGAAARILYLEDETPLSADLKSRLRAAFGHIDILYDRDASQIKRFGGVPFTELTRRNLRFDGLRGIKVATGWPLPILNGARFDVGYIYHSGLFCAKAASVSCDRIVMRESGLNNYVDFPVAWPKAMIRCLVGLPAFRQVWGEEQWVDAIQVSKPGHLPHAVRHKGHKLTFPDVFGRLTPHDAALLGSIFVPERPVLGTGSKPRALLLTQPLDGVALCSTPENRASYQHIADELVRLGYEVHVKFHPREKAYPLEGASVLSAHFPIELWAPLGLPPFDLAVAICSASLIEGDRSIAHQAVQLLTPDAFTVQGLKQWRAGLPKNLAHLARACESDQIPEHL